LVSSSSTSYEFLSSFLLHMHTGWQIRLLIFVPT
jgi:hypothetical protein